MLTVKTAMSLSASSPPAYRTIGDPAHHRPDPAGLIPIPWNPNFTNDVSVENGGDDGGDGMTYADADADTGADADAKADIDRDDDYGGEHASDLVAHLKNAVLNVVAGWIEETCIGVSIKTSTHAAAGDKPHPPGSTFSTTEEEGGRGESSPSVSASPYSSSSLPPHAFANEGAEESRAMERYVCRIVGMLRPLYPVLSVQTVSDRLEERQRSSGRGSGFGRDDGIWSNSVVAATARMGGSSDNNGDDGGRGGGGCAGASRKRGPPTRADGIKVDGTDAAMTASDFPTSPRTRKRVRIAPAASVAEADDRVGPAEAVVAGDGPTFGYRRVYENAEENGEYQKVYSGSGSGGNRKGEEKTGDVSQKDGDRQTQQQRKEEETTKDPPKPPPKLPRNRGGRPKGSGKGPYRARGSGILTPEEKYDKVRCEATQGGRHCGRFVFDIFLGPFPSHLHPFA